MKNHTLNIKYVKKIPDQNSFNYDGADGSFLFYKKKSIIYIKKTKDHKDTLIHELSHFILGITIGHWYGHSKKFKKLYGFLKKIL